MIETFFMGQTASDNWFVLLEGDDILPDMHIGRLPASNLTEAADMVAKVIAYEQNPPDASWNQNALFIADDGEEIFEDISEELAGDLPYYYTTNKVYVGDYPVGGDPTGDITSYINSGSLLVNYTGHGAPDIWGSWSGGNVYDVGDVGGLSNTDKYPVVTVANCLSGFFVGRANPSIAEALLTPSNKGAVAVWAPSSFGLPGSHEALMDAFYEAIFQDDLYTLGEADHRGQD